VSIGKLAGCITKKAEFNREIGRIGIDEKYGADGKKEIDGKSDFHYSHASHHSHWLALIP